MYCSDPIVFSLPNYKVPSMRIIPVLILFVWSNCSVLAQSTILVRNSTWQDFDVEAGQYGTFTMDPAEWEGGDPTVRGWLESTGQEVLTVNRTNTAVPVGDTAYFDIGLNGATDALTIKLRLIGVANGTTLDFTIDGAGFSIPFFNDGLFHEVQTTLAGKDVVLKFKADNDDSNMDRDIRFAIHNLPVYEIDEQDFQNPNVLNAMFYNIQMITFGLSGMPQAEERGALLPAQISEYQDVVVYAEAFDDVPREDHLIPAMEAAGFPFFTDILNPPGVIPVPTNGGVIIFSRWPILAEDEIDFAECGQAASDCLANKGVKYASINKMGKIYHVFGTHMDAGGETDDIFARRTQMAEMRDFIADLDIPDGEPVIFGGDFNTEPTGGDMDYQAFLDTMSPVIPQHIGFYESNFGDHFGNIIDHAWSDRLHLIADSATNEIITIRSLDPVLWDISEFSDHRCVLSRFEYPDISHSGGDTLICPGDDLILSVETSYPVTYQWYKDGAEISGETSNTYEISNALESQSGAYSCLVSYNVVYGNWTDSLNMLFYPQGIDTVEARLNYDFGEVVIDDFLCHVGVSEFELTGVEIYPNPTRNIVNVSLDTPLANGEIRLFSYLGGLVQQTHFTGTSTKLDLTHLVAGIYLFELRTSQGVFSQQIAVY